MQVLVDGLCSKSLRSTGLTKSTSKKSEPSSSQSPPAAHVGSRQGVTAACSLLGQAQASPASRQCHPILCTPAIFNCLLLPLQFSGRRWQPPSASFEEPRPAHKKTLELKLNQSGILPLIMTSWLLDGLCLLGPLGPWLAEVRAMKYGALLSAACEFTVG